MDREKVTFIAAPRIGFALHSLVYRDPAAEYDRLQQETIASFKEFKADVSTGAFPERGHCVEIGDGEFKAFMKRIGR